MKILDLITRKRGLGHLPDGPDPRDTLLVGMIGTHIGVSVPNSASVANRLVTARDQGATNSCVGQAWSQALRLAYLYAGIPCPELSALFTYSMARATHRMADKDQGTSLRAGAKASARVGAAAEISWPFSEWNVNKAPGNRAFHSAFDHRGLRGYYRIVAGDIVGVKRAITAGYPVVGGWAVDREFLQPDGPLLIGPPRGEIIGSHAMVVESYVGDAFGILNSWGAGWRAVGKATVTPDWIAAGQDLWAVDVRGVSA